MKPDLKVSIITVCLNSAATVEQTVCSVLGQTYSNIEYIIIDGGSTDGTQRIIGKYRDKVAYYYSGEDSGIYNAMNKGIRHAKGDIIGILNSDDWYMANAVELAVNAFKAHHCQAVYGDLEVVYPNGESRRQKPGKWHELYKRMVIGHPSVFALAGLYQKYGGFDEKYKSASDYDLVLRWQHNGVDMHYIPEIMACYRKGGYSETGLLENRREAWEIARKYAGPDRERRLAEIDAIWKDSEQFGVIADKLRMLSEKDRRMLQKAVTGNKDAVIFCTGGLGLRCYDILSALKIPVCAWVDNDREKQGKKLLGLDVLPCSQADPRRQKIIIGTKDYVDEIVRQLESMGITDAGYIKLAAIEHLLLNM